MFAIAFFWVTLVIAPQLWLPPFIGIPVDFIVYPLLMLSVFLSGRLQDALRFTIHDWLMFGFVVWVIASAIVNGWGENSQHYAIFYAKVFVLYKLISVLVYDFRRLQRFMSIIIALVLVLGIEVLSHRFSDDGLGWAGQEFAWIDPSVLEAGGKGRAKWVGIFDGPGVFAVLFTIALPFFLPLVSKKYGFATRVFALSCIALILVATYFIGSRGGMLAAFAIIGLYSMIRIGIRMRTIVMVGVLGVVLYSVAPSHLTTIRDESNSSQYRVEMWAEGLEMMKQNPIFGIGRGNFQAYTSKLIAHNSAVEIGGETGLVGLFLWLALIYACIKSVAGLRETLPDEKGRDFCIALILAVIGYIVSAMFVTLEYETFYALLAACAATGRFSSEPAPMLRSDYVKIGALVLSGLAALQVFVVIYLR